MPNEAGCRLRRGADGARLSAPARADPPRLDLPETLTAMIDFRVVLTDGERSWTDGGFGRSRFGGGGEAFRVHAVPAAVPLDD